ncbi:hypothetical protein GQ44DRAFT_310528 [Phaeosphaeriaceae sp. PMI808]|nr:hypothetical protein GQ44DRAFT_310528 [Phaeosphaeriaceae sp. PMI808]
MDPLTALGLAANVVQFISFTSELLSKSNEIYTSAKGCSSKVFTLEPIYEQLQNLSLSLELSSRKDSNLMLVEGISGVVKHVFAINELSRSCKEDCDRLLGVLRKLRGGGGSKNRWESFKLALKTIWKDSEIHNLEQRLHYAQTTLTLQICSLTRYQSSVLSFNFW